MGDVHTDELKHADYQPVSVKKDPHLLREETVLNHARRSNLQESISGLQHPLRLLETELSMTEL